MQKLLELFFWATGLIIILLILLNNIRPLPDYNWDSIPYSNLALKYDGIDNDSIRHQLVYQELRKYAPPGEFKNLAETTHWFRLQAYQNYKVLTEQLPYFAVKPLYILNVWAFNKMGVNLIKSTWLPSLIAYLFLALIFFQYISTQKGNRIAFFATLFIMLTPPFMDAAKLGTPDLLGTLMTTLLVLFFLENKSIVWLVLISILAILVRPDHIILCGLIIGVKALEHQSWKKRILYAGIPALLLFTIHFINFSWNHNPGWKMLFMHSFQGNIHFPLSEGREWDWSLYWETLDLYLTQIGTYTWIVLFPFLLTLKKTSKLKEQLLRKDVQVFIIVMVTIVIKYFLHPLTERFHTPFYAIGILLIIFAFNKKTETI